MMPPEPHSGIRASDRDRELASRLLRDAYAEGRLDLDEFIERTDAACSARTWGELGDLTADLPAGHGFVPGAPGDSSYRELAGVHGGRGHPCTPLWLVAFAWLAIAAAAHVAAAIPLVLLSLFLLYAARWHGPPAGRPHPDSKPPGTAPASTASCQREAARSPR